MKVELRDMAEDDLPVLFELHRDPESNRMAAFIARDPNDEAAFMTHWKDRVLADDAVVKKTVLADGEIAGWVASFRRLGKPEVAYWIGTAWRGKGVATTALTALLEAVPTRPLYASAAGDNTGSLRVLQKCGFKITHSEPAFSTVRGADVEEVFLELDV